MKLIFLVVQVADEVPHEPGVFNINLGVSAWTFIIFILLMVLLAKFAFPPILGYAAAREKRIQDALDDARRHREETEQLLAQQREQLERARQQAQQMIAEGKAGAERLRAEALVRARGEQEELLERAKREIADERDLAIESLRREAVDLAMAAAGQLVGHRVDSAADRKLVTEYLQTLDRPRGGGVA